MSKSGERLLNAAREALAIAKGEAQAAKTFIPADIKVREIRHATKLTQEEFAASFGFTVQQIRDWEQQRSRPLGGVRAYLMLIGSRPEEMRHLVEAVREDVATKMAGAA